MNNKDCVQNNILCFFKSHSPSWNQLNKLECARRTVHPVTFHILLPLSQHLQWDLHEEQACQVTSEVKLAAEINTTGDHSLGGKTRII